MRKRLFAILLTAALAAAGGSLVTAYAAETEPAQAVTEAEQALSTGAAETESETQAPAGLEPASATGDEVWIAQYPAIEAQVEQQLRSLSGMSQGEVEQLIKTYNKQINLSVGELKESMDDSTTLTEAADSRMATVKMLRNWYSVMDTCGEFEGIESYDADMTDGVLNFRMDADYAKAKAENTAIEVKFQYDVANNLTLINWEVKDSLATSIRRAAMNTLIGIGTVFIVLLFLSFLIAQIHWVPDLLNKKKETPAPAAAPAVSAPAPAPVVEEVPETDDLELVAVITAAIAAGGQAPADGFVVRSIRRRGRKSNWRA